jgi:hypothetical protein
VNKARLASSRARAASTQAAEAARLVLGEATVDKARAN